jgi:peptidoglycan/LPS O-acetylase OafA/YrhL
MVPESRPLHATEDPASPTLETIAAVGNPSPASAPATREKLYFYNLDIIRALAAFFVVLQHAKNCFFVDYHAGLSPSWKVFYFFSNFGHQAVIVFFVLSGCVVGRLILRDHWAGKWAWRSYLFDRFTRLWIVLIPALALTVLWDALSLHFSSPEAFPHGGAFGHLFNGGFANRLSGTIFAGNVAFVQTILVPTLGSNGPLWSLANEFWYYIAFPLLFFGLLRWKSGAGMVSGLAGIAVLIFTGPGIAELFPVWLMGVGCYLAFSKLPPPGKWAAPGAITSALVTAFVLITIRANLWDRFPWPELPDLVLGLSCSVLIYYSMACQPPAAAAWIGAFFSKFSYSLYLLHLPLLAFVAAIFIQTDARRMKPTVTSFAMFLSLLLIVYLYAWAISLLTEARTGKVRKWLTKFHPSTPN